MKSHQKLFPLLLLTLLSIQLSCLTTKITLDHPVLNVEVPSGWEDESVVVISDSIRLELKKEFTENTLYEEEIIWYKVNDPSKKDLQKINIVYNKSIFNTPEIVVHAVYKNGKVKNIRNIRCSTGWYYTYSLYKHKTGETQCHLTIPDYKNIQYIRLRKKNRTKRSELFGKVIIRNFQYNVLHKRVSVEVPETYKIKCALKNKEQLDIKQNISNNCYVFEAFNLPKIKNSNKNKYPELWYSGVYFSLPPKENESYTWQQLGEFDLNRYYDSLENSPEIDSLSELITATDSENIIKQAFDLVKNNIRYYGSWEKAYALKPRSTRVILQKGYGDCKEMASILTSLLRNHNINAWPCYVQNKGFQYIEEYPSLGHFNHVVVCVEKQNGYRLYLDPTNKYSSYKTSYYGLIGQKVLLLGKSSSVTDQIKPDPEYKNQITTENEVVQGVNRNEWMLHGRIEFRGEIASDIYWMIKNRGNTDESTILFNVLDNTLKIKTAKVKLEHSQPLDVIVSYETNFNHCMLTVPEKGIVFSVPAIYTPNYYYSDLTYYGNRYLYKVEQTDTWIVPEEFSKHNLSPFKNDYGKGHWVTVNNKITRKYSCKFSHISAEKRDNLKEFYNERNDFARGIVWAR